MEPNELMIGDWVDVNGIPAQVFELAYNTNEKEMTIGILDPQGDVYSCWYGYDYVEPIPITEAILKKNGFELCKISEIEYIGWRLSENFSLTVSPASTNDIDGLYWNDDVPIRYVHQLQHALRLCNIEKDIEL